MTIEAPAPRHAAKRQPGLQVREAARTAGLGERGAALVEFALVAPVLLLIMLGTAQFGITLNQYVMLTNAVGVGGMQFAISRSDTTPYTDAVNAIKAAAPNLTPATLAAGITLAVNGTTCTTDGTCQTLLTNNIGKPATVTATYPCSLSIGGGWYNFAPGGCTLSSQMTERVQ
jgi:Flp pilus assembly protein TadG